MRRPPSFTQYVRPRHFSESTEAQLARHKQEAVDESFRHSLKMGKAALRDLETSLMQGNVFDAITAEVLLRGKLRVEGVSPDHIDAVVSTFLPQYLERVGRG